MQTWQSGNTVNTTEQIKKVLLSLIFCMFIDFFRVLWNCEKNLELCKEMTSKIEEGQELIRQAEKRYKIILFKVFILNIFKLKNKTTLVLRGVVYFFQCKFYVYVFVFSIYLLFSKLKN